MLAGSTASSVHESSLSMSGKNSESANAINLSQMLNEMIAADSLDYQSWRSLLLEIETLSPDDINIVSLAYDSFLSKFPLCHWHLEKYAYHKAKLCGAEEAIKIFEQGMEAAMFSVGFWVAYFTFATACFGDPKDVRRLFWKALSYIGKDYFCHALWDKYMKYELSQEGWGFLAQSYIQTLRFPSKKLQFYYDNFKQFVANLEDEIGYEKNHCMEVEQADIPSPLAKISRDEISCIIKELLDSSDKSLKWKALVRYRSIGEKFYQEAHHLDEKINCFEANIRRRYFCVTPLDESQLDNWHLYLDFIEKQNSLDWAVQLYERCLIPCATYPEFWIRYVEFLEHKGGRELATVALERSTKIYLKSVPEIHLFSARFKEYIGDTDGAHAAFLVYGAKSDSTFIDNIVTQANMERRLGNFGAASAIYEKAIKSATEKQRLHVLPSLYSHFAWLTFMITGKADAAREVLIDGIRHVPRSRFLLEELIKFAMMHEGATQVNAVDSMVANAILPGQNEYEGLNAQDRETISCLYLEFVDLCGTVNDIRKAWLRHVKLFPKSLRSRPMHNHFTSDDSPSDVIRDKKGKFSLVSCNRASQEVKLQEQILKPQMNQESDLHLDSEIHSPQMNHNNDCKDSVAETQIVLLCNEDADRDNEQARGLSCHSREDDGPRPMDVTPGPAVHSKENALGPFESTQEFGKSSGEAEPVETSQACKTDVQQQLDREPKQPNQLVSMDNESVEFQEKELGLMASDKLESNGNASVSSMSKTPRLSDGNFIASPKRIQVFDHPRHHNELDKSGSMRAQNNKPKRPRANSEDHPRRVGEFIQKDHMTASSTHASSGLHGKDHGKAQRGAIHKDETSEKTQPPTTTPPPSAMSTAQSPFSSPPVSYPQEMASVSGQHSGQMQQNLAMNQMLQYYQQQQQYLQYQQQHLHMQQQPYIQMQQYYMNQQPPQMQPQQQSQQYYVQPQQMQPLPYQFQQQFQLYQQQGQHMQSPHDQQSQLDYQQYRQSQGLSDNMNQIGYQQQLYFQQYQQYQQNYPQMQQQQQPQEVQEKSKEDHQDEQQQQHHQQGNSKQNSAKDVPRIASPAYDRATAPSGSPHLQDQ